MSELDILPRVAVALAIGATIGLERQWRHQAAGLRTHTLVAMACALVIGVAELTHNQVNLATGILGGVGFIGAGAIIRNDANVVGLSTAGTVWMVAALGVVVGAGYYVLALSVTVLTLFTVEILRPLEQRVAHSESQRRLQDQATIVQQQAQVIDALTRLPPAAEPASPGTPLTAVSRPARAGWWRRWF